MIQSLRSLSWGGFINLRTPNYIIQVVIDCNNINLSLDELKTESAVKIKGILKEAKIKNKAINPRNYEIHAYEIEVISPPSEYPLPVDTTKKELKVNLDTNFDFRPLSLRHPKKRAIFKVASIMYNEFGNYLTSIGFTRINSPKLVATGAEGGANVFELDYFGKKACLAQSPQFYKQMMVGVFGRVFEQGPVFRAESHKTSRHINEYTSLDLEMALEESFMEIIQVEVNTLNSIFAKLKEYCSSEIELLDIDVPFIDNIVSVRFDEVHKIVYEKYNKDYRNEKDLAPEEEGFICEYAKKEWGTDFVAVTHYPTEKRPFYAMDDPENPHLTLSFDLLYKGLEITTGGQRIHRYEDYMEKMKRLNLDPSLFSSFLQTFKFGMPPHGGLGLGLERLTAQICNLSNIKEATLFPRDIYRLEP